MTAPQEANMTTPQADYKIQVVDAETGEIVKTLEAHNLRTAERIDDGLNINLNHMKFFTRIVEPKETL